MSAPFRQIVETSRRVAATSKRLEKTALIAECLQAVGPEEVGLAVAWLSGELPRGRPGLGPAAIREASSASASTDSTLRVVDVDGAFRDITEDSGAGSKGRKISRFKELLESATEDEQRFLVGLAAGGVRQGALDGVMADAVAKASGVPASDVRRAIMFTGDAAEIAGRVMSRGRAGLDGIGLTLFRPVKPMLAQSADAVGEALGQLGGRAALQWKLDGARIQVHRQGDEVKVYTRKLNDVTAAVPEVVEAVLAMPSRELVLDGEAITLRADGRPHPFQTTMRRFGRKLDVEALRSELPLSCFFFDCLHRDGTTVIDEPEEARFAALADVAPAPLVVPRSITAEEAEAAAFLAAARSAGHEGLVAKALDAPYEAGRRGKGWVKVKPSHTLDLVVLAAEWGSGRRKGKLSNLHLGARDPATGGWVMLGKTFKGMTDEILAWQTEALQAIAVGVEDHVVHVEPRLVVEIAFNDVQRSPRYPGGMALRFARLKAYRPDKRPEEADTIDAVRNLLPESH